MISKRINLSTGPVSPSPAVRKALHKAPISHRSRQFMDLYHKTTTHLSKSLNVRNTYLLSGSGTLANETMLQEIKCIDGVGLILSNGEFGNRLVKQARANNMKFESLAIEWGKSFDMLEVEKTIASHSIKWLLFCHCETSTGVINDLQELSIISKKNNCQCFADCMSTVGTTQLDLCNIAMATASSGKGLASIPGLAVVFSNIQLASKIDTPIYLDLCHYSENSGMPFTFSSNLLQAFYTSTCEKLQQEQFELIKTFSNKLFSALNAYDCVPFSNIDTKVFTITASGKKEQKLISYLKSKHLVLSDESDYLKRQQWCQLATFGYYNEAELKYVLQSVESFRNARG